MMASVEPLSLTLSDSLYIMTMSDLHHHSLISHSCMKLDTTPDTLLDFLTLPEHGGFALKHTQLNTMPWDKLAYIFNSKTESRDQKAAVMTGTCMDGGLSSYTHAYKFFERELRNDPCVLSFLQQLQREPSPAKSNHTEECSFCEEYMYDENGQLESLSGSDTPYEPTGEPSSSSCSEVESEGSDLEEEKEALKMQRELLMEHVIELESSSIKVHKAMIGEKRALMVQEQGLVAKYNTDMSTRPKTVFCHAYNNYGYCKFYKACCYKHEDAPTCKFDMLCTRTKCGYYHTPKPSPGLLSLKEQVQLIDELFANEASNKKLAKDTLSLAKDSDVIMTEKKTEGNVMVCDVDAELISMIGGLALTQGADKENTNPANLSSSSANLSSTSANLSSSSDPKIAEISFEDSGEEGPWDDFRADLQTKSRSQFDAEFNAIKEEKSKYRRQLCAEDRKKKLPGGWEEGFPDHHNFPLLFLLTSHPEHLANMRLTNRVQRANCVTWSVTEARVTLGIAVMLPILPDFGDRPAVMLFGEDEVLGLCMLRGDTGCPKVPCPVTLDPCLEYHRPGYMKYFRDLPEVSYATYY